MVLFGALTARSRAQDPAGVLASADRAGPRRRGNVRARLSAGRVRAAGPLPGAGRRNGHRQRVTAAAVALNRLGDETRSGHADRSGVGSRSAAECGSRVRVPRKPDDRRGDNNLATDAPSDASRTSMPVDRKDAMCFSDCTHTCASRLRALSRVNGVRVRISLGALRSPCRSAALLAFSRFVATRLQPGITRMMGKSIQPRPGVCWGCGNPAEDAGWPEFANWIVQGLETPRCCGARQESSAAPFGSSLKTTLTVTSPRRSARCSAPRRSPTPRLVFSAWAATSQMGGCDCAATRASTSDDAAYHRPAGRLVHGGARVQLGRAAHERASSGRLPHGPRPT